MLKSSRLLVLCRSRQSFSGFSTGKYSYARFRRKNNPDSEHETGTSRINNSQPGIGGRLKIIKEDQPDIEDLELAEDDIEDMEQDFLNSKEMVNEHEREMQARNFKIGLKMTERKFFKQPAEPNLLSWSEKEQIRNLHSEDRVIWTVEKLSESFPATEDIIAKVLKAKWKPSDVAQVRKHDEKVAENWKKWYAGELTVHNQNLREHLKKFNRRNFQPNTTTDYSSYAVRSLPEPKSSEFSSIIESYKQLKLESDGDLTTLEVPKIEKYKTEEITEKKLTSKENKRLEKKIRYGLHTLDTLRMDVAKRMERDDGMQEEEREMDRKLIKKYVEEENKKHGFDGSVRGERRVGEGEGEGGSKKNWKGMRGMRGEGEEEEEEVTSKKNWKGTRGIRGEEEEEKEVSSKKNWKGTRGIRGEEEEVSSKKNWKGTRGIGEEEEKEGSSKKNWKGTRGIRGEEEEVSSKKNWKGTRGIGEEEEKEGSSKKNWRGIRGKEGEEEEESSKKNWKGTRGIRGEEEEEGERRSVKVGWTSVEDEKIGFSQRCPEEIAKQTREKGGFARAKLAENEKFDQKNHRQEFRGVQDSSSCDEKIIEFKSADDSEVEYEKWGEKTSRSAVESRKSRSISKSADLETVNLGEVRSNVYGSEKSRANQVSADLEDENRNCGETTPRSADFGVESRKSISKSADLETVNLGVIRSNVYESQFDAESKHLQARYNRDGQMVYRREKKHAVDDIAYRIRIPKDKIKKGYLYKVKDCFYTHEGEFLYRVPGMT